MIFSASRLGMWMSCPLKAKFRYVDRAPSERSGASSFGTVMHYVVEQIDRGMPLEEAEDLFRLLWKEPERLGVTPDYYPQRTSYDSYLNKGIKTIKGYGEMRSWGKPQFIAHEYSFLVPLGEFELTGHIDRIDLRRTGKGDPDVLAVVDFKTSAKRPTKFDLRTNIQMTIYNYALTQKQFWTGVPGSENFLGFHDGEELYEQYKDYRRTAIWLMLGESCTELDAGDRGDMDFAQLYRLCTEVDKADKEGIHIPRIGADSCGTCDYFDLCGLEIPKPQLDEKIDNRVV